MKFSIQKAEAQNLPHVARLAAQLVRLHGRFDRKRFSFPSDVEGGYLWWLGKELKNKKALVLAAMNEKDQVVGYLYATLEERDWNALRDPCCAIHDILVEKKVQRHGVAKMLMEAVFEWGTEHGKSQTVLHTAWPNKGAQQFFAQLGFRPTMIEMTRDGKIGGDVGENLVIDGSEH